MQLFAVTAKERRREEKRKSQAYFLSQYSTAKALRGGTNKTMKMAESGKNSATREKTAMTATRIEANAMFWLGPFRSDNIFMPQLSGFASFYAIDLGSNSPKNAFFVPR